MALQVTIYVKTIYGCSPNSEMVAFHSISCWQDTHIFNMVIGVKITGYNDFVDMHKKKK